ncbi:MAG: hypothetical protein QM762_17770 [Chryseolinea sp.]
MKIIQSFWSKPAFHTDQNYSNARGIGGWLNFRYFLMSTALSCLTLKKHHKRIELVTDSHGKSLFSDILGLPFDHISTDLDQLSDEDHRLWILGKMKAIRSQEEPFIHVDNDVFVWESLPSSNSSDYLIAQSRFPIWGAYKLSLNEIFANFAFVPECLAERPTANTMVANVGIIGGNDIEFFQEFARISNELLERNRNHLQSIDIGGFNQMMEEYLFTSLVRHKKRELTYLLESSAHSFPESHLNFSLTPMIYKYIHLIGRNKQILSCCEQIALRLKIEFPEFYKKVNEVVTEFQGFQENSVMTDRQERLMRSILINSQSDLALLERRKIRLVPGVKIHAAPNETTGELNYIASTTDATRGNVVYKTLPQEGFVNADRWLKYFTRPISIAELYERLRADDTSSNSRQLHHRADFEILSAVMWNIVVTGIFEYE